MLTQIIANQFRDDSAVIVIQHKSGDNGNIAMGQYLFNIAGDERERANRARLEPKRQVAMRQAWLDWNASMPPVPPDATVSLGFSVKDMPQR